MVNNDDARQSVVQSLVKQNDDLAKSYLKSYKTTDSLVDYAKKSQWYFISISYEELMSKSSKRIMQDIDKLIKNKGFLVVTYTDPNKNAYYYLVIPENLERFKNLYESDDGLIEMENENILYPAN